MKPRPKARKRPRKVVRLYPCEICGKEFEAVIWKQQHLSVVHNVLVAVKMEGYSIGVAVRKMLREEGFVTTSRVFVLAPLGALATSEGGRHEVGCMVPGDSVGFAHSVKIVWPTVAKPKKKGK